MTSSSTTLRLAVIVGSVRQGRIGGAIGTWVRRELSSAAADIDHIDLRDYTFPDDMSEHADVATFTKRIGEADGVIVVTPEYNHSIPGPLKTAIDSVRAEWFAKPIGLVSYGGMAGGLRAVEALRLVFAELHAVTVRDSVSLHNPWQPLADAETPYPDAAAGRALRGMLGQLSWWATALREARTLAPYPG